jgi:tRNA nucleotidyltransferase (CCA-adding enzyme)
MDLILCHTTADFDTLGGAVGLSRLLPGARIVLTGGAHPTVQEFLAFHRDEYALVERRSVNSQQIRSIAVVDTQWRDRLGKAAEWLDLPGIDITVYDHHLNAAGDIAATDHQLDAVGAVTTLVVEQLRAQQISLTVAESTVMSLGIHVDTGSLTYDHTTVRDAAALTWLMEQGANLQTIAEYVEPSLSTEMQDLLAIALEKLATETLRGCTLSWVLLTTATHVPGMSQLASRLLSLTDADILLLAVQHPISGGDERLTVIGRAQSNAAINLATLFQPWGGGGHAKAAALTLRGEDASDILERLLTQVRSQLPHPPVARELMSSPVRTIRPETTIAEAQRILLRYGHSGLSVVDAQDRLVGIISRRDLDIAFHHGFDHAPVKGYMATNLKTIAPDTELPEIEALMVTYDIGRLPVLEADQLVGIVTRTDVLRQLHQGRVSRRTESGQPPQACVLPAAELLRDRLIPPLWELLQAIAQLAEQRGWQIYLVGGAVRDLLLAGDRTLQIEDIDLVVDGFHQTADQAAGVALAQALQAAYPQTKLQVHGQFQTAALLWHNDPLLGSLWLDIATARTEFYPYPAANPQVEASSIRQDLYRRDFTMNALAIRLTHPRTGELLDFFGGMRDLQARHIRVLHANSFIEDPTRIYRAVRFAVRLGFQIEPQTEGYIRYAIASGIYSQARTSNNRPALQTRLKQELKYILQAPYWKDALQLLSQLGALVCIHPDLQLQDSWQQLKRVDRWLKRFDPNHSLIHWQILLEVLLASLPADDRLPVAQTLQLPAESCDRLAHLHGLQTQVAQALSVATQPSQVVKWLSPYDRATLLLVGATVPRSVRRVIWRYLTCWQAIKPPLDGNDLKAMGYSPGKQYREILDLLLAATLDGAVGDRAAAEAFVKTRFSLTKREEG